MSAGITAKIGRLLFSASAKRVLGQPHSTLDFDDIMSSNKILICNFSKGLLGEDTASLFGITVMAKLQIATMRRARMKPEERRPFYLYVDEFQNFATTSFVQLLSEARKFRLYVTMAEQSTSQQQDKRLTNIILANVGTVVCFRTASPDDAQLFSALFEPFISATDISYLAPFHFFIRIASSHSEAPFSGETLRLPSQRASSTAASVISDSRRKYAQTEQSHNQPSLSLDLDDYELDAPATA
jgi:hypothetical protein